MDGWGLVGGWGLMEEIHAASGNPNKKPGLQGGQLGDKLNKFLA